MKAFIALVFLATAYLSPAGAETLEITATGKLLGSAGLDATAQAGVPFTFLEVIDTNDTTTATSTGKIEYTFPSTTSQVTFGDYTFTGTAPTLTVYSDAGVIYDYVFGQLHPQPSGEGYGLGFLGGDPQGSLTNPLDNIQDLKTGDPSYQTQFVYNGPSLGIFAGGQIDAFSVNVLSTAPEPSTFSLFLLGISLAWVAKRKLRPTT